MTPLRTLIADDELPARIRIQQLLEKSPGIELVALCRNGSEAVEAIRTKKPDLVFLDVQMPNLDGFGVVREVGVDAMPLAIFVTAYDSYALKAFEASALDYLLKPFSDERFEASLQRARKQITAHMSHELSSRLVTLLQNGPVATPDYLERIVLKSTGRLHFLDTKAIDWIEGAGVYVILHTGSKTFEHRATVGQLEQRLNPRQFVRVHRSAIVNMERISELQARTHGDYTIILKSGAELMLSRAYRPQLESWLKQSF